MLFLKTFSFTLSTLFVFDGKNRAADAFIVPRSTPLESFSFASLFQKTEMKHQQSHQQRMSIESFRLDYIQDIHDIQISSTYSKQTPLITPVDDDENEPTIKEDFVYGRDSTCYHGLTNPTKASLVLAGMLAGGMVITSPELQHIPFQSLQSLLDGTFQFILGDNTDVTLSALVERLAFQWDMSDSTLFQISNHYHEGLVSLSNRFDGLSNQIDFQAETMKGEFIGKLKAIEVMVDQVVVNSKEMISQQGDVWQQKVAIEPAKIEQWQHDLVQATDSVNKGINQLLIKGKDTVEETSLNIRSASQIQVNHWRDILLQGSNQVNLQTSEAIARGNDAVMSKSSEIQKSSQMHAVQMKQGMIQMHTHVQAVTNQLSTQAKDIHMQTFASAQTKISEMEREALHKLIKFQDEQGIFFQQAKISEIQQLGQAKLNKMNDDTIGVASDIQRLFSSIWKDVGLKQKEIGNDFIPMIQDSSRVLHEKNTAFQEASLTNVNKAQEHLASQFVSLSRQDSTTTEAVFLKSILSEISFDF